MSRAAEPNAKPSPEPSGPVEVELGPVQKTLLIPLLGRAEETRSGRGLIHDPKSVEIVDALDYDFDKWRNTGTLVGASIRARIFDAEVSSFLERHPEGTVVEIGAGLNTRYERLDNGRAQWLEIDLPDSMKLRERFFSDTERRTMVATDVLQTEWLEQVSNRPPPYCFVSEAVLIYLDESKVRKVVQNLSTRFPGALLITDTTSAKMVDNQHRHGAMKHLRPDSWFRWKCDDPKNIEPWGLRLERSKSLADAPTEVVRAMSLSYRLLLRWAPFVVRRMVQGYGINRFVLSAN